jgi:hypothetical protein
LRNRRSPDRRSWLERGFALHRFIICSSPEPVLFNFEQQRSAGSSPKLYLPTGSPCSFSRRSSSMLASAECRDAVEPGTVIGNAPLPAASRLELEPVDQIDDIVEAGSAPARAQLRANECLETGRREDCSSRSTGCRWSGAGGGICSHIFRLRAGDRST